MTDMQPNKEEVTNANVEKEQRKPFVATRPRRLDFLEDDPKTTIGFIVVGLFTLGLRAAIGSTRWGKSARL